MRLVDQLRTQPIHAGGWQNRMKPPDVAAFHASLRRDLERAQIIVADQVADYAFREKHESVWKFEASDFPTLAPPYPLLWIEMRRPREAYLGKEMLSVAGMLPSAWGILLYGLGADPSRPVPEDRQAELEGIRQEVKTGWMRLGASMGRKISESPSSTAAWKAFDDSECHLLWAAETLAMYDERPIPELGPWTEDVRWQLRAVCYADSGSQGLIGPAGEMTLTLDSQGMVKWEPYFGTFHGGEEDDWTMRVKYVARACTFSCLLAVSFMNCKNVSLVIHEPPPKLSRAHQKRHGKPLVRFHTLDIQPMREILRTEGRAEEVGLKRSLHLCRGHFKDYREGGLFGKHHGLYWWEPHVRGSLSEGIVAKDYRVLAPKPTNGEPSR